MFKIKEINNQLAEDTFFTQTEVRKIKLNILSIITIYFLLWLAGLFLGRLIADFIMKILTATLVVDVSLVFALRKLIVCGIQIFAFFSWVRFVEKRPIKTMGFQVNNPLKAYVIGFLVGFSVISLITGILIYFKMVEIVNFNAKCIPILLGAIALGWGVQSASEEIAVRGWLIPLLGNRSNPFMAIILTSIIFGILHLFTAGVTALSFINMILSGACFAGYAIYTSNIWGTCGLHFAWNFALGNIYGFPVSGFISSGETVLTIRQVGAKIFTGGSFGPEGGFITTVILVIAFSILSMMFLTKYHVGKA